MRCLAIVLVVAVGGAARADEVDDLVAKGEELAKTGELSQAIAAFKAADAKQPRAKHACLIGLAYTRRELWPQAELFFALCHARATDSDPLPDWIAAAEATLVTKLSAIHAAAVTVQVTPATVHADITVSSFEPDEIFPPHTIHLTRGNHVIEAAAPGYVSARREVVITDDQPQTIVIPLRLVGAPDPNAPPPPVVIPPASRVPWIVGAAGVAVGLAGGAYHVFVFAPARDKLATAPNTYAYADDRPAFRTDRDVAIGLYTGAAALVATAIVLRYTIYKVHVAADAHGAMAALEWRR